MQLNTVIFDMDGLLIDSEPLWAEAADEAFSHYGVRLTKEQHATTTGMRVKEFVGWWLRKFRLPEEYAPGAEQAIYRLAIEKVKAKGLAMPGVQHIFNYFIEKKFRIGLASASNMEMINTVTEKLGIKNYLQAVSSAHELPYGKPHPQVYLDCAEALGAHPAECICFEDSFNGLIAAKAAGMKCVVVPSLHDSKLPKFNAADLRISSLQNFNDLLMKTLLD
jgi:mannitol-1-/sugar-/sorbitol-6-/2-deoxyglucose-6-phosphatase